MIAYIEGTVLQQQEDGCVVLVHGIGYRVALPARVAAVLSIGESVSFHIFHYIREDAEELFGFEEHSSIELFEQLITVKGIGPRMALALFSALPTQQLQQAIMLGDVDTLSSVSGVGKKTAERIVLDLKERIAALPGDVAATGVSATEASTEELSAIAALVGLGYSQAEALAALQGVDSSLPVEEQVRHALQRSSS